ncbi:hypothetical protein EON63_01725 [archaeon]|nr:MAG: hypothetical protein EON63_01725 [archaeon]
MISNWVAANPSLEKKSTKMLVYSNVLAIKKGCITAKSMRQYAIGELALPYILHNISYIIHHAPCTILTILAPPPQITPTSD